MKIVPVDPKLQPYFLKMTELLEYGDRAGIILPTGSGKSHLVLRYLQIHTPSNVLFITSQNAIIRDFDRKLEKYGILLPNFQSALYCTLSRKFERNDFGTSYETIILDEYRHCGAAKAEVYIQSVLRMNAGAKIIGMDATPIRYLDKRGPYDMTDPLFQGRIAAEVDLYDAFSTGLLIQPDYLSCYYDLSAACPEFLQIPENQKYRFSVYRKLYDIARHSLERAQGLENIFARYLKYPKGKYIVFCRNRNHMSDMMTLARTRWFRSLPISPAIYWDHSKASRHENNYHAFNEDHSDHLRLLFCINMFNEGIHLEDVDGVILLRPTSSPNILYQQIGRCMSIVRKDRQPQIIDLVLNLEELEIRKGIFRREQQNSRNKAASELSQEDDILPKEFSLSETESQDSTPAPSLETFRVSYVPADMTEILLQIRSSLKHSPFLWEIGLNIARYYYKAYGNLDILPGAYYLGFPLGDWADRARSRRWSKGLRHLHEKQIAALDMMRFNWYFEPGWNAMYRLAKEYYEEFGNLLLTAPIPKKYKALPGWLARQRGKHNGTISPPLSPEQIRLLDKIGMIWDLRHRLDRWYAQYYRLLKAIEQYPDLNIPSYGETADLYRWTRLQIDYLTDKRPSPLNRDQEKLLLSLNLPDLHKNSFWKKLEFIRSFKDKYGELPRNKGSRPGEKEAYQWMRNQLRTSNLTKLDAEKTAALRKDGILH